MHPPAPSPPVLDDPSAPRLILRDGSVATVRRSTPQDRETTRRFFHELSPESRRRRFFTAGEPTDARIDRLCDSADERRNDTLVAIRQTGADTRFIAVGSYLATDEFAAEAAFAVDDRFQDKGLATELLGCGQAVTLSALPASLPTRKVATIASRSSTPRRTSLATSPSAVGSLFGVAIQCACQ